MRWNKECSFVVFLDPCPQLRLSCWQNPEYPFHLLTFARLHFGALHELRIAKFVFRLNGIMQVQPSFELLQRLKFLHQLQRPLLLVHAHSLGLVTHVLVRHSRMPHPSPSPRKTFLLERCVILGSGFKMDKMFVILSCCRRRLGCEKENQ